MDSIFNIGFNSSCSDTSETATVPDRRTSYNASFTLHGCNPPSGVVTANLLREGTNVDSTEEGVTVSERPTVPEITISRLGPSSIDEGQSARFIISASQAPSSNLVVNIDVDETGSYLSDSTPPDEVTISGGSSSYTLSLPTDDDLVDEPDGEIEVTIESDTVYRVGDPPSASVDVEDDDPHPPSNIPPTVALQISDKTFTVGDAATTIGLEDKFSDADGDTLRYTAISSQPGVATARVPVTGSSLTLTPVAAGTTTIAVRAHDRPIRVPGGQSVSQSFDVTVNLPPPTITIARHSSTAPTVTEGADVGFTLTASSAPPAALTVKVIVTDSGSFLTGTAPSEITITSGSTTADLILQTADDTVDEANGTIRATVQPGPGYSIGSTSSTTVAVEDDDVPPAPTGLRANGNLVNDRITLRWDPVSGATGYNVRYAEEVCVGASPPRQSGDATCGLGNPPAWVTITARNITTRELTIDGVTVLETSIEFTPPDPLRTDPRYNTLNRFSSPLVPWPLYRVEVQAVVVDNSDWSDFTLVFPTSQPPFPLLTQVAASGFFADHIAKTNGSHEYRYTLCTDTITTDVAWSWGTDAQGEPVRDATTVASIAATIEAGIKEWETAVRWAANNANIVSTTATVSDTCPGDDVVKFIPNDDVLKECRISNPDAWGCNPRWSSNIFMRQTLSIMDPLTGTDIPIGWDAMAGACSLLHITAQHEAGHVFGATHSSNPQSVMYETLADRLDLYCEPQVYDVVAMMVNYQSR